jgi:hypothetical protein
VVNAGLTVGRGWSFVKYEVGHTFAFGDAAFKDAVFLPKFKGFLVYSREVELLKKFIHV